MASNTSNPYNPHAPRRQPNGPRGTKRNRKLHNQRDTYRADDDRRSAKTKSLKPTGGIAEDAVPVPTWMRDKNQISIFKEIRAEVVKLPYAEKADIFLIQAMCAYYAQWADMSETIADEGWLIASEKGVKVHHLFAVRDKAFNTFRSLCREFGMGPSARKTLLKALQEETEEYVDPEAEEWDDVLH